MWYTILLKCALTHYDTFYYYIMQAFFCQGRFFIFVGMPLKHGLLRFFFVNLHKPDGTAADSKGNTAQRASGDCRTIFVRYCPKSFLQIVFTFFVNHAILIEAAPHRFRMPVLHGAAGRTVPLQ